ncbi:hypothetical protein [Zavarzinella formosa]|uniref:hypothetical protein n=1 Tax=Zavarzinella formosa TaxID=360055 RepID=UPI00031832FA|nr:hypothetical protein [Zavarzinella formosa]
MEIKIYQYGKKFGFELVSGTNSIMQSTSMYTRRRAAMARAMKIAKGKLKVVVE